MPPPPIMTQFTSINLSFSIDKERLYIYTLPNYHRDPFDHMFIAQAQLEGLPSLIADTQIAQHKVEVIW